MEPGKEDFGVAVHSSLPVHKARQLEKISRRDEALDHPAGYDRPRDDVLVDEVSESSVHSPHLPDGPRPAGRVCDKSENAAAEDLVGKGKDAHDVVGFVAGLVKKVGANVQRS